MAKRLIPKVTSLLDLRRRAGDDPRYATLAIVAARNLGGSPVDLDTAMRWLNVNANETTEKGVVGEINFCRDLV